jgi:hypothetical protein
MTQKEATAIMYVHLPQPDKVENILSNNRTYYVYSQNENYVVVLFDGDNSVASPVFTSLQESEEWISAN